MHVSGYYAGVLGAAELRSLQLETMTTLPGAQLSREVFESNGRPG